MATHKILVENLFELSQQCPLLDVRSPGEYLHAHIPGAYSLPLFNDEERKIIGTAYKKESREKAIKLGLDFFGVKMKSIVEDTEKIIRENKLNKTSNPEHQTSNIVIVHCWRGGMRSSAVAWLLNFYGFEVYLLEGGYKAYRNWVLQQFESAYDFNIIGGYTGSGKTALLKQLQHNHQHIIDLEALANHKGSTFGALEGKPQPKQEMFENLLAITLYQNADKRFWIEDESQRIGALNIPNSFWNLMRSKPVYFIEIPFEQRLAYIITEYGSMSKELLIEAIGRIQKRLGPNETKMAINFLKEENIQSCFSILLNYYDKTYLKSLNNRENLPALLNKIACLSVDTLSNTEKLISCTTANS